MAAIGKAASKKGETSAYNLGDEGFYEDDGAGLDDDYYFDQMKKEELREKNKVYKRTPNAKEQQDEEFEQLKAKGLVHLKGDKLALLAVEEARLKELKKAEKLKKMQEQDEIARLEALRLEKQRLRKYHKSSDYKRKCWEEKLQLRCKHDAEWEVAEKEHTEKEAEFKAAKELYDRQRRIDESWQPKRMAEESQKKEEGQAKPKPQPKGKRGKGPDLSKYGGALPPALLKKQQEAEQQSVVEKLPWDPAKGEKDPNRPEAEKKAEEGAWEKKQKAWRKHLEEWSRIKQEHAKEVQRMTEQGLYDSEPEFHTDPDSDAKNSDSDSDSDF